MLTLVIGDEPDLDNLGITPQWLSQTVNGAGTRVMIFMGAPNQQALYRQSYTDRAVVSEVVPEIFGFRSTDDYPRVDVTVRFDGTENDRLSVPSRSFSSCCLSPWPGPAQTEKPSWCAHAEKSDEPRADSRRRTCWAAGGRDEAHIKSRWEMMDVENRACSVLDAQKEQFIMESAGINESHPLSYGKEWKKGNAQETNLKAILPQADSTF